MDAGVGGAPADLDLRPGGEALAGLALRDPPHHHLPHSVDASGSDETRISVSFNVMPSAFAEKMSKPLW